MLNDPIAHASRQKIDNRGVNLSRRGKRPAFLATLARNFHDLIGELFMNPAIDFRLPRSSAGFRV